MEYGVESYGIEDAIKEGTTYWWEGTLKDPSGTAIPGANVTAIVMTLVDGDDPAETVINGRDEDDVLNTGGGELDSNGFFRWAAEPGDAVAIGTKKYQKRKMTFVVTYNQGVLTHQVQFYLRNLTQVP